MAHREIDGHHSCIFREFTRGSDTALRSAGGLPGGHSRAIYLP
jgi:hypothetical protein